MRRNLVTLALVGFAGAVPLVAAGTADKNQPSEPAVAVQQVRVPVTGLRDEAAMVLVGTALIGLGAAVRRAA